MNKLGAYKGWGVTLLVVGVLSYFLGIGRFFGYGIFGSFLPMGLIIAGVVLLIMKDSAEKKDSEKTYKSVKPKGPMKIQYLFYIVGVIFIFASVWYFTREFIASLPNLIKLILLFVAIVISFVVAEFMRGGEI